MVKAIRKEIDGVDKLLRGQPIWVNRLKGVGWLGVEGCLALGVTGPMLRAAGLPWDLRKTEPYLRLRDVRLRRARPTTAATAGPGSWCGSPRCGSRCGSSSRCSTGSSPGPVMVDDPKIAWPAQLSLGPDGMGNSLEHVKKIMGQSMESLIHHFKLVTEGFRVPPGQVYVAVESPARRARRARGQSDGGTRPYRVHLREPVFVNLQAAPAMADRRHDRRRDRRGRLASTR